MSVCQCETCQHWQRRGGIVLSASLRCVALDDEQLPPRAAAILIRSARDLASRGLCPAYAPWPNYPDAYRAADLPTKE